MPWPKDHKAQTRDRIIGAAAAAFRAEGVSGVGVDDIMSSAGLTRGGFYAHFSSKDDLLAQALERASCQTLATMSKEFESVPVERRLHAVVDAYLSRRHAAHPDRGCPVAALGPELARAGGRSRRALAGGIRRRLEWLRELAPRRRRGRAQDEQVVGALACMVGGLILARALGGKESEEILESCRGFLHRALSDAPPASRSVASASSEKW
jgi:TetR/AcrR family transcriptional repressor of nem operon